MGRLLKSIAVGVVVAAFAWSCSQPLETDLFSAVRDAADTAAAQFALTVSTRGGGTVSPVGTQTVAAADRIEVEARPFVSCEFAQWTVVSGSAIIEKPERAETLIIEVHEDTEVAAVFTSTLRIDAQSGGTVDPPGIVRDVPVGFPVEISATPADGYSFGYWQPVSGSPDIGYTTSASTTATLKAGPAVIEAVFSRQELELTVLDDGNGTTTPTGSVLIAVDESYSIKANPKTDYEFVTWDVVEGAPDIANADSRDTHVILSSGAATIRALFAPVTHPVTVVNDRQSTSDPPAGIYELAVNETMELTVTGTTNGFHFTHWEKAAGIGQAIFDSSTSDTVTLRVDGGPVTVRPAADSGIRVITNDRIFPNEDQYVGVGDEISLETVESYGPFPYLWVFTHWYTRRGVANIADPDNISTTAEIVEGDRLGCVEIWAGYGQETMY